MTEGRAAARALAAPDTADTIAALASPPGRGARAVVRVSGPRAHELAGRVFESREGSDAGPVSSGRQIVAGVIHLEGWPEVAADLWRFFAPRSYTGEDVAELHVPGAPPLVGKLLRQLEVAGARAAQPGEFTRRAFLWGKLDRTRAEAVLELTRAEADGEARTAARALLGGLRGAIDQAKSRALDALAHIEATIDFPEEDLPGLDSTGKIAARLDQIAAALGALERRSLARTAPATEPVVALAGAAHAGKSTLLNALAGRDAAIVSAVAGTTRDPIAARFELAPGRWARIVDTAGEKIADGPIEVTSLMRGREQTGAADLVLRLVDLASESPSSFASRSGDDADAPVAMVSRDGLAASDDPSSADEDPVVKRRDLVVGTKLDLVTRARPPARRAAVDLSISAHTGAGLAELRAAIARALDVDAGFSTDAVQTERQSRLVARGRDALARAARLLGSSEPARLELAAVDIHEGLDALGELTGALVTDDLLDKIFGEFCIGK